MRPMRARLRSAYDLLAYLWDDFRPALLMYGITLLVVVALIDGRTP